MKDRAEILKEIKTPDPRFSDKENRVLIALHEYQAGFPVDQTCVTCGFPITVTEPAAQIWATDCRCHQSASAFRGL
ncbi:hypothetical protein OVA24_21210 [Luteolibacter sp. SL250]|uniref:hypothetical protein n=1 Tax=Luteolibacter sp. SL250 TaxID=2995170 RepID=UPI002271F7DC|nr:hypothetical protein [Luteolibacter sp. SL250]WAC19741.1 hypothetical protein OVA24_21210 [Luteolibacter sp. SL250]